ncbi:MAG: hypothetical protein PHI97_34450 [Desulfobulbus sp.]|jgi:hypothetical protein|nr:hypothetical protein [Desulfobulbus sp.]
MEFIVMLEQSRQHFLRIIVLNMAAPSGEQEEGEEQFLENQAKNEQDWSLLISKDAVE